MKRSFSRSTPSGRRRRATVEERQQWIESWAQSQQTQAEFAAEHGLSVGTLRNWVRRASHGWAEERPRPKFVEIDLERLVGSEATPRCGSWEFEIRLPCGRVVAVAPQTPIERLQAVLEVLRC